MTKFINTTYELPSDKLFDEETILLNYWMKDLDTSNTELMLSAGFHTLPEPLNTQTVGTVLVAKRDEQGALITEWVNKAQFSNICHLRSLARNIRNTRDNLLKECDWSQGKDISEEVSSKWTVYRQALRDITQQETFPTNVIWPKRPS